jgi:hypothetical protein
MLHARIGGAAGAAGYRHQGQHPHTMQDDNSLDIADILLGWIGKQVVAGQ